MNVLDNGSVELINFMGGDEAVVAAARVSNGALYATASKGADKDEKLIRFLMKHNHTSPFEHSIFTFYIKCPLFVAREWQRHRTWSYNEVSGRYTEFSQDYYVPDIARVQDENNKQKSVASLDEWRTKDMQFEIDVHSKTAWVVYNRLLSWGIAREVARLVVPVNYYTAFYGTVDAHNLMRFLRLRDSEDAQWEIQQYAKALKDFFEEKMPMTAKAFKELG